MSNWNPWASDSPAPAPPQQTTNPTPKSQDVDPFVNPWGSASTSSSGSTTTSGHVSSPHPSRSNTASTATTTSKTRSRTGDGSASPVAMPLESPRSKIPEDLLLIVFIHGFKGTDTTFEEFPQRLQHLLTETTTGLNVECLVFPAYDTKGELDKAVIKFADWLTGIVVEREVASGGGAGSVKVVICGHSMGGLLAADSLREFVKTRAEPSLPLWPNIIACLAFDTPYLGLHPSIVRNGAIKAAGHVNAATTIGSALFGSLAGLSASKAANATVPQRSASPAADASAAASALGAGSGWAAWAGPAAYAIGGAVLAGAAAGGAYYARDHLNQSYSWMMEHMRYVGALFDVPTSEKRLEDLVDIEESQGVVFRNFYTHIPPAPPTNLVSRTFCVLPRYGSRATERFVPAQNTIAPDEIQAHTGMFSASTNDGYYGLGLSAAKVIREAYSKSRTSQKSRRASVAHASRPPSSVQPAVSSRPSSRNASRPPPVTPHVAATQTSPLRRSARQAAHQQEEDLISF